MKQFGARLSLQKTIAILRYLYFVLISDRFGSQDINENKLVVLNISLWLSHEEEQGNWCLIGIF